MSFSHPTISALCLLLIAFSEIPCSVLALSASSRASVLACHNNYRSTLAKGTAANLTGTMPAGSNLIQLKYNTDAERIAQNWANQCTMERSNPFKRRSMGENSYKISSSTITEADALKQACDAWWAELKQHGLQSSLILGPNEYDKDTKNWTEQAWAKTAQIGCAMARCRNPAWKTWVVCNYSSRGSYIDHAVYKKGTACSGCSDYSGASCNSTSGLCVLP
uniref:SCP domain-containing protein n=1 Tax=Globodera rostochiensis TaxID=31243 RepID=A0A914H938_GLORO